MARLQALGLSKEYGGRPAVRHLDLTLEAGEIFCLLGQNGAGKTTTINLFLGFTAPTAGKALINNEEIRPNQPGAHRHSAYLPEVVMLYGNLTALENLDFFSRLAGFRYRRAQLEEYLGQAGLQAEAFGQRVGSFSKGMRQKVGIAIAVAKQAQVVFMDEPTSGLDPKATSEFTAIVKQLGQAGTVVFMATHDLFNAVNVGTRLGIMRRGELVQSLAAADITASDLQRLYLETI